MITVDVTGRSAIRVIQCYNYDIALVDLNLPDIYGVEIIKSLREHSTIRKIIVATTYINEEIEKNCANAGVGVLLSKPLMLDTLRDLL